MSVFICFSKPVSLHHFIQIYASLSPNIYILCKYVRQKYYTTDMYKNPLSFEQHDMNRFGFDAISFPVLIWCSWFTTPMNHPKWLMHWGNIHTIGACFMEYIVTSRRFRYDIHTVYPKKYAHGFVVLCFVVVMQSFIMNSHEVFIHIHQGCFAGTGSIVRLPQCQWSKPDGYGKIGQCITTTKHCKAKTVCIFLGIYCILRYIHPVSKRTKCEAV